MGIGLKKDKGAKTPLFPKKPKEPKEPKAPKEPKIKKEKVKKEKAPKEQKVKKEKPIKAPKLKFDKNGNPKAGFLNIRNKIYLCFIVPIVFMVIVGIVSYRSASDGLTSKFMDSSTQTINMAVEYLDLVCTNIQSEAARFTNDKDFESYVLGMPGKDNIEKSSYYSNERVLLMATQAANSSINNVHLITKAISPMISTSVSDKIDGVYDEYIEFLKEETGLPSNFPRWITSHTFLDDKLRLNPNEIFISYQVQDSQKMAYIIVDIKRNAMVDVLKNFDFGKGSYVAIITADGKEVAMECGAEEEIEGGVFSSTSFYADSVASEELSGSGTVDYNGSEYLFIYQKSELTGLEMCTLIPSATVTGQAESIKTITVILVIAAAIIATLIGSFIAAGIQNNMKRISKKLDEVAKGDLTVSVVAKGNDEFQGLTNSANNMVANNKNLIESLVHTADNLESSAVNVNDASETISNYSNEITQAIDEISLGMDKQSEHALECVNITNTLSERIQDINSDVDSIHDAIRQAEELIKQGMEVVNNLSVRATETSNITAEVGESIAKLEAETKSISQFVQTISSIAEQTNLLSLNASIEAARAGAAGRGFAVVAEEIRNLADNSSAATVEIDNKIKNINVQTRASVESASSAEKMVSVQQEAVNEVIGIFNQIFAQMNTLVESLDKISESVSAADKQRNDTVDAVDNISAIIEQTAASSSLVRDMAVNLLSSVDRLGQTADTLDSNMNGLKKEISVFHIDGEKKEA